MNFQTRTLYTQAEAGAGLLDRGDDYQEAKAIRQLVAEHKAMTEKLAKLEGAVEA